MKPIAPALTTVGCTQPAWLREQRIHTPLIVMRALELLWPDGVALDPCGSPDGIIKADCVVMPPDNGLHINWPNRTYFNPPYEDLEPWFLKYGRAWECVGLVPHRTHRKWFRAAKRVSSQVVELDPLTFLGYEHPFPAPLVLLYRGDGDLQAIAEQIGLVDNSVEHETQTELAL
jgi:hypothetical protein